MNIELVHTIEYKYSEPVFIEPHLFRIIPQQGIYMKTHEQEFEVSPDPTMLYSVRSVDGEYFSAAFSEMVDGFKVGIKSILELTEYNPFDFIVYPGEFFKVPFKARAKEFSEFKPYLKVFQKSAKVKAEALRLAKECGYSIIDFMNTLNSFLNKEIKYETREEGNARLAEETLDLRTGSCRDISFLFVEMCRALNIPSRFVSGYHVHDNLATEPIGLHAWAEAFIPGAGWKAFDPTLGLVCFGRHVTLSTSAIPYNTLPVKGCYRGSATSEINYHVYCKEI